MGTDMKTWRQKLEDLLEHIQGAEYVPGESLPEEVTALGSKLFRSDDGEVIMVTKEGERYTLEKGGIITVRKGVVGYNAREKLERKYEEMADDRTGPTA